MFCFVFISIKIDRLQFLIHTEISPLQHNQNGCGVHPASHSMGANGSSPRTKLTKRKIEQPPPKVCLNLVWLNFVRQHLIFSALLQKCAISSHAPNRIHNRNMHRPLQNLGSAVWSLLLFTLLALRT
jgi:hypothetical protein